MKKGRVAAKSHLADWRADAKRFVYDCVGINPTPEQAQLLDASSPRGAHVSVRSGHGVGKTSSLALLLLWVLCCFDDVKIPCTAPTGAQLRDGLWPEVSKWRERMAPAMRARISIVQDRISIVGRESSSFAVARTARPERPEALQGFHAKNLLFIIEEASGVHEKVFEVAEGALSTPGARVIMAGNPTRNSGYFYDSHHKERSAWTTLHFSSEDSRLVSQSYCDKMARRYGKMSNTYRIRVAGDFPEGGDDVVIPLFMLEAAQVFPDGLREGHRRAGLDIARFGDDDSALSVRDGCVLPHIERWHGNDTQESAGRVIAAWEAGLFDEICVDAIGVGGGTADTLRHFGKFPVIDVNVGERPTIPKYNRLRDQLWFAGREWFTPMDVTLTQAEEYKELIDELVGEMCGVTYTFTPVGKLHVEPKDKTKDRIGHSPDLSDSLLLTFAPGSSVASPSRAQGRRRKKRSA